ncbi:MAG TPA: threonine--tRNA ligase [Bacillota bacterium]|nr:threonine--tRNA ligase [Clostridiales bacterium]HPT85569.1 threonine--tRNA ligase [Bacillota bacterium]
MKTAYEILKENGQMSRDVLAASVNGELCDLTTEVPEGAEVKPITFEDDEGKKVFWHTSSHVLAAAVKRLFPDVKLTIGPAIDNGFYYDFDTGDVSFTPEVLEKIEAEMKKIIKENYREERFALPRDDAKKLMEERGEPYKVLLIDRVPEGDEISFYRQGEFIDLCAGPHLYSVGAIKAFKLLSCTGAYWEGDSKNKMLQRVYGISFPNKAMLDEYLAKLEEAKKRDHRKIGREMDLFDIFEEGPGFPFFFPKGMVLRNLLEDYWRKIHREAGYQEIKTPIILNRKLWETSGHWDHYRENMYTTVIDETDFAVKPMNCPGALLVYKRQLHSYRDLPIRYAELGLVHRHELSGTLHGLMRVRCFTQDDAHIFMMPEQIKDEIIGVYKLIDKVYSTFGLKYTVELSTRPENSIGTDEAWEQATNGLKGALDELGVQYKINEGDGAFYGPKIDFHIEDSLGRTWQCGTIQLDMNLPERFDITYIGADNQRHRPVMIHRVVFGALERFIGIITEHFAGSFPLWLAPVQVKILPIVDSCREYCDKLAARLDAEGIRYEKDYRSETINFKIREAQLERVPYMLVVGEREVTDGTVAVRSRKTGKTAVMRIDELIANLREEIDTKAL